MVVEIKLTKRNRDKYLQEFTNLEGEYLGKLKDFLKDEKLPNNFEDYTIENFYYIWDIYKLTLKKPDIQVRRIEDLTDIETTDLPICFAYYDWGKFRLWLNEESLKIALGLAFYLSKIFINLNKKINWTSYIEDDTRDFMEKNHPIMINGERVSSPVSIIMRWSLQYLRKDEYFIENEKELLEKIFILKH